jgi:beta-fructofuranosidase
MHWEELPIALGPGDGDDGTWSGSIVVDDHDTPRLFYTAIQRHAPALGAVRTATPADRSWRTWDKGPVVVDPARDYDLTACRDPFVFRDGHLWRMLIGVAFADGSAGSLTYSSPDLASWNAEGVTATRASCTKEPVWTGTLWECPQLLRYPSGDALIASVWHADELHDVVYGLGAYAEGRFEPTDWKRLTVGKGLYAASTFRDREDNQCVVFWVRGTGDGLSWAGAISTPYRIELGAGQLILTPHPAVEALWTQLVRLPPHRRLKTGPQSYLEWTATADDRMQLTAASGLAVAEMTLGRNQLHVEVDGHDEELALSDGLPVRIIADGSVLEISTGTQIAAYTVEPVEFIELSGGAGICRTPLTASTRGPALHPRRSRSR